MAKETKTYSKIEKAAATHPCVARQVGHLKVHRLQWYFRQLRRCVQSSRKLDAGVRQALSTPRGCIQQSNGEEVGRSEFEFVFVFKGVEGRVS